MLFILNLRKYLYFIKYFFLSNKVIIVLNIIKKKSPNNNLFMKLFKKLCFAFFFLFKHNIKNILTYKVNVTINRCFFLKKKLLIVYRQRQLGNGSCIVCTRGQNFTKTLLHEDTLALAEICTNWFYFLFFMDFNFNS